MIPPRLDPRTWLPPSARGITVRAAQEREKPAPKPRKRAPTLRVVPPPPPEPAPEPMPEPLIEVREDLDRITNRERVLVAAAELDQPFTKAEFALRCWQKWPQRFALRGHPQHPDTNAVWSKLWGSKSATSRGWIECEVQGSYSVTYSGFLHARACGAIVKREGR